jgi:hypothetical protein
MALMYLVQKPQVFNIITWWLLLLLEYDFTTIHKLNNSHFVVDILSFFEYDIEPFGVLN